MDNKEYAKQIVETLGRDNIQDVSRCATRLRFHVKDHSQIDDEALEKIDIVKGTVELNDQFQVFVGLSDIVEVYDEIQQIIN